MEEQRLSFEVMLSYLYRALEGLEDPRQLSNAQRYSLRDLEAIVNSKILGAETLDTSFRLSSMDGHKSAEKA